MGAKGDSRLLSLFPINLDKVCSDAYKHNLSSSFGHGQTSSIYFLRLGGVGHQKITRERGSVTSLFWSLDK